MMVRQGGPSGAVAQEQGRMPPKIDYVYGFIFDFCIILVRRWRRQLVQGRKRVMALGERNG